MYCAETSHSTMSFTHFRSLHRCVSSNCTAKCFERVCVACTEDQFKCENTGRCIPASWICDDENDCGDYSDERNCSKMSIYIIITNNFALLCIHFSIRFFFDSGNGFPTATNVVVVVVVVVRFMLSGFKSAKTFPFLNRS